MTCGCFLYNAEWHGLGLEVRKLAAAAKVSPDTVIRFERGERIRKRTIDSLRQVLEAAGVGFTGGRKLRSSIDCEVIGYC